MQGFWVHFFNDELPAMKIIKRGFLQQRVQKDKVVI